MTRKINFSVKAQMRTMWVPINQTADSPNHVAALPRTGHQCYPSAQLVSPELTHIRPVKHHPL